MVYTWIKREGSIPLSFLYADRSCTGATSGFWRFVQVAQFSVWNLCKIFSTIFPKTLDFLYPLWYNVIVKKGKRSDRPTKKFGGTADRNFLRGARQTLKPWWKLGAWRRGGQEHAGWLTVFNARLVSKRAIATTRTKAAKVIKRRSVLRSIEKLLIFFC